MRQSSVLCFILASVVFTIVTRIAVLGGNPGGFLLLPTVYIVGAALLMLQWSTHSGSAGGLRAGALAELERKVTMVVMMAFLGIGVSCCVGASSLGGFHHHAGQTVSGAVIRR